MSLIFAWQSHELAAVLGVDTGLWPGDQQYFADKTRGKVKNALITETG
jgi:hypothetical protein